MTDRRLEHMITFAMICVLSGWFLFNTAPAFGMTPDEVDKAKELLKRESVLQEEIKDAKIAGAEVVMGIYVPFKDKTSCRNNYYDEPGYRKTNGQDYCLSWTTAPQKMPPSVIVDLQNEIGDVEKELCRLGVHEEKK